MDPEEAFAGIADQLLMAKDDEGQTFIPESGINAIGVLRPGRAYQLFVSEPVEFSYSSFSPPQEFVYDQECLDSPDAYEVHTYGPLTEGPLDLENDWDTLMENQSTINTAIDQIGAAGGGTICLPKGRWDVAPVDLYTAGDDMPWGKQISSILIDHSNITLWGAGRNDDGEGTAIYSNGTLIDLEIDGSLSDLRRGHAIAIGDRSASGIWPARTNITLRDFELNGQGALPGDSTAYTGCDSWQSRSARENCWDTTHKGINTNSNGHAGVDSLFITRVAVRSFKGEQLYSGGTTLGYIELDDIISEDTNAQALNVHGDSTVVKNSYLGLSMTWAELFTGFEGSVSLYENNTWENCHKPFCITFSQGDGSTVPFTIKDNHFSSCGIGGGPKPQVFGFGEGTDGPIEISNNTFDGCGLLTGIFGGTSGQNARNITIEDNVIINLSSAAVDFTFTMTDYVIRNNSFTYAGGYSGRLWEWGWGNYDGVIENNTFDGGGASVGSNGGGPTKFPIMRNNTYINFDESTFTGRVFGWREENLLGFLKEEMYIRVDDGTSVAVDGLRVGDRYVDGQEVTYYGIQTNRAFVFSPGNATYEVGTEAAISAPDSITFEYNAAQEKWIEVSRSIGE
jgi:hypothetical protein